MAKAKPTTKKKTANIPIKGNINNNNDKAEKAPLTPPTSWGISNAPRVVQEKQGRGQTERKVIWGGRMGEEENEGS